MKIEVNLEKKYVFLLIAVLFLSGAIAYNTNNPSNFGHTIGEIQGLQAALQAQQTNIVNGTGLLANSVSGNTVLNVSQNYVISSIGNNIEYKTCTATLLLRATSSACTATCSPGKKVIAGGCSASSITTSGTIYQSEPTTNRDGWSCGVWNSQYPAFATAICL